MEGTSTLFCKASAELRAKLDAAAAAMGISRSEFMRRAVIHAMNERDALASHSGMRKNGRPFQSAAA